MTATTPYLRRVRVLVGPLEEWRGGGDQTLAVAMYGDGSQAGFRINFDVHTHVMSTATPTRIQIFNLSQGLRDSLQRTGVQVSLEVGWANTEMALLHTGSLLAATTSRQGADIITELVSHSAFGGLSRTIISESWASGAGIKGIVLNLAQQIPGVVVDPKNINLPATARMGGQGWAFAGPVNEALDRLARVYGFSWRVENKIFYALTDGAAFRGGVKPIISTRSGTLMRAEPLLCGWMQAKRGVSIRTLLNPHVRAGGLVALESELNPNLNGDYVVHALSHSGDTHGPQWHTQIESFVQGGGNS